MSDFFVLLKKLCGLILFLGILPPVFSLSADHLSPKSQLKGLLRSFTLERTLGSDPTEDLYFSVMDRTEGKEEGLFLRDKTSLTKILTYLKRGQIPGNSVKGLSVSGVWLQEGYLTNIEEDFSLRIDKNIYSEDDFIPETETGGLFNWKVAYGSVDLSKARVQIVARTPETMKTLLRKGQKDGVFKILAESSRDAIIQAGGNYYSLVTQQYFNQLICRKVMNKAESISREYLFSNSDSRWEYERYMFWDSLKKYFSEKITPEIIKGGLPALPVFLRSA